MERERTVEGIRAAFAGVTLGDGVSLRQAQAQDRFGAGLTRAEFDALPNGEITDDWTLIPEAELRRGCMEFLDDEGLRYYLPAFMLWLLENYPDGDFEGLAVIGTMAVIAPGKESRAERYEMFDAWTPGQRVAIAAYVEALPKFVELHLEDSTRVERAIRDYWHRFLPQD